MSRAWRWRYRSCTVPGMVVGGMTYYGVLVVSVMRMEGGMGGVGRILK